MRESDLAQPVMDWLIGRGLTPFGEVPWYNRAIDIIGLSDDAVEAVELKRTFSRQVLYQAHLNQLCSNRSWCAVATTPRNFTSRLTEGVGLLTIKAGKVEVLAEPSATRFLAVDHHLKAIRGACFYKTPGGEAGVPTMAGIGPAQAVYDEMQRFLAEHPNATWRRIFDEVPNHYKHARSMQGAMRIVRDVRAGGATLGVGITAQTECRTALD